MTDIRIKMNVNNTGDIHATVINKTPISILSQDRQYRFGGYAGRITIDLTDNDSSELTKVESTQMPQSMQKNSKFPNFFIDDENEFHSEIYADQSRERFFRSNTEIFNQILKVRKDIAGLRRDIRKIKEFVQHVNISISQYDNDTIQQFDKRTLVDNFKDVNFPSRRIISNFSSKSNIYKVTTKPTYTAFPRTVSIISPMLMSRLQANAAAPALKEEKLRNNMNGNGDNRRNSTKDPVESAQERHLNDGRIVKLNLSGHLFPSVKSGNRENQNLFLANESNDMIKSNPMVNIIDGCGKNKKIHQKSTIYNYRMKNETFMSKEQEIPQLQRTTNAKFQLLVTVLSPNSEKEVPKISVTEAYQPFSITRYTARSKINSGKQFSKLISFSTSKPLAKTHRFLSPVSVTLISGRTFPHSTILPRYFSSSTKNISPIEFDNNSHAVILSFASPTASKTSGHTTATQTSTLLSRTKISNTIATIITGTIPTSTAIVTTTNAAITGSTTAATTTSTNIITTINSSTMGTVRPTLGFEKITRHNLGTMPPLIPLKPNFFGSNFDGIFVPWFNDPQLTLWPDRLFRRG